MSILLASKNTLQEAGAEGYIVREIGLVKVKGKDDRLPVVEIVGTCRRRRRSGLLSALRRHLRLIAREEHRRAVEELLVLKALRMKELGSEDRLIEMYLDNLNLHLAKGNGEKLTEMVFEIRHQVTRPSLKGVLRRRPFRVVAGAPAGHPILETEDYLSRAQLAWPCDSCYSVVIEP